MKINLGKTAANNAFYDDDNDVMMREAGEVIIKPHQYIVYSNGKNSASKYFLPCKSMHRRELERLQRKKEAAVRQDEIESKDEGDIESLTKMWNITELTTHDEKKYSKGWTNEEKPFGTTLGRQPVFGQSTFGEPTTLDGEKRSKDWINDKKPFATNVERQPVFGQNAFSESIILDEKKNSEDWKENEKKPSVTNLGSQIVFGQSTFASKEGASALNPTGFLGGTHKKIAKFDFTLKKAKKGFDRTTLFSAMRNAEGEGESDDDDDDDDDDLDRSESGDISEIDGDDL